MHIRVRQCTFIRYYLDRARRRFRLRFARFNFFFFDFLLRCFRAICHASVFLTGTRVMRFHWLPCVLRTCVM